MKYMAALILLLAGGFLHAAPVKLQGQGALAGSSSITGKRDTPIKITATEVNPKAGLIWRYDAKKLKAVSCNDAEKHFVGPPGTYEIEVWSVFLDAMGKTSIDSTSVTLTILPAEADPVVPVPVDPVVPDKPKPKPDTPSADPLIRSFQDAYNADKEPDKAVLKAAYVKTFKAAATDAVLAKAKTTDGLFDAMGVLFDADGVSGKIINTQEAVNAYLEKVVPPVGKPLRDSLKETIKKEFTKIASALEAVK